MLNDWSLGLHRSRSRSEGGGIDWSQGSFTYDSCACNYNSDWMKQTKVQWASKSRKDESCFDYSTPGYSRRIAAGEIINNPYYKKTVESFYSPAVNFTARWTKSCTVNIPKVQGWNIAGSAQPRCQNAIPYQDLYQANPARFDGDREEIAALAVTSAFANVDVSEMLALASAAESRKTVDSMVGIMGKVIRIAKNVRKLNFSALSKELSPKNLAEGYMEARYAIRPLIYDANGLMAAIEKPRQHVRRTFRGSASRSYRHSDTVTGANVIDIMTCTLDRIHECQVSAYAGVMTSADIEKLSVYGADQLAETAWELFPFSFIVDWFANVGDTIAAWTPNLGITQRASWVTVRTLEQATNSGRSPVIPVTGYTVVASVGQFQYGTRVTTVERVPSPRLEVFPSLLVRLDGFKLLDLGIIARQILR